MTDLTGSTNVGNPAATAADGNTAAATGPWYGAIEDADLRGFAELKGWKGPGDAIQSYRNLEKLQGLPPERLAKIPDVDDATGWTEFNKRFGWAAPEKAEDYGLSSLDAGFDPAFIQAAEGVFHRNGLPKELAVKSMTEIGGVLKQMQDEFEAGRVTTHNGEVAQLQTEWGANYDKLIQTAARAVAEYMPKTGLGDADMDAIRDALGSAKFNKLWAGIGSTMGEAAFHEGKTEAASLAMTPDAARVRLSQLGQDKEWFKRYESGGVKEVQEYQRLRTILANATLQQR